MQNAFDMIYFEYRKFDTRYIEKIYFRYDRGIPVYLWYVLIIRIYCFRYSTSVVRGMGGDTKLI